MSGQRRPFFNQVKIQMRISLMVVTIVHPGKNSNAHEGDATTESGTGEAPWWTGSSGLAESGLWLTMRSVEWIKR